VRGSALPRGVQLVGSPFKEAQLFRAAAFLEAQGVVGFSRPT
jgi:Asp-tRNA(Asn)/Glu-tRNA(Gln) amidotransferase A subunit family amidase